MFEQRLQKRLLSGFCFSLLMALVLAPMFAGCSDPDPAVGAALRHALDSAELQISSASPEELRAISVERYVVVQRSGSTPFTFRASRVDNGFALAAPGLPELEVDTNFGFIHPGRVVKRAHTLVYSDGDAALVRTFSAKGVKENVVATATRGGRLQFEWKLQMEGGLELREGGDGTIDVLDSSGNALYRVNPPVVRDWHQMEHHDMAAVNLDENGSLNFQVWGLDVLPYPITIRSEIEIL